MMKVIAFIYDILQTFVLAGALFVITYLFIMQPNMVKGASMETSFYDKDYILTEKITYRFSKPKRGDVVVFQSPNRPDIDYIKRIIALPGETIMTKNGSIYINGKKLEESYEQGTNTLSGTFLKEGQAFTVPEGTYFVLGDNRLHSSDSREFGTIAFEKIRGRAILRYWPLSRFGLIKRPIYSN